jgi:hypothetical protein
MKLDELGERRKVLLNYVYQQCNGEVQHGLFQGMKIANQSKWGDGDTGGKLLGVYEDELTPRLEQAIEDNHDLVINYGCAEGFYGIGMAMHLPESRVVMIDIDVDSLNIARDNASRNNIINIEFSSTCNDLLYFNELLGSATNPLVIMDCEGYEILMLDPVQVPNLKKSSIIVEMHDCIYPGITDQIVERFAETHYIGGVSQGAKNLHIDPITGLSDVDKFILVNENRPCTMHWLYIDPIKEGE